MSVTQLCQHLVARVYTVESGGEVIVAFEATAPVDYRRAETFATAEALRLGLGPSAVFVRTCGVVS